MKSIDKVDEFLINGLKSIKLEECSSEEVKNMILEAKNRKKDINKVYKMVASFIFVIAISAFGIYMLSNGIDKNVTIQSNDNYLNSNEVEEAYVVYSKGDPSSLACRGELNLDEMYDLSKEIAIVTIEEVKGTNYDLRYEYQYNGDIGYTFVRTIGKLTIQNSIKGNLKEGESVEFRKKGGRILYKDYLKYYEVFSTETKDSEIENSCQDAIKNGVDINNIYVDISVGFRNVNIEAGKTYLVYLTENISGYWIQAGENGIREYNAENNTILNNETGEWESLDSIKSDFERGDK